MTLLLASTPPPSRFPLPDDQRLRIQDRHRERHRERECELAAHAGDLPDGDSDLGEERLPVEHPGAPHLVRDPGQQGRLYRARAEVRSHGRAQSRDVRQGRRRDRAGGMARLRLVVAAR